LSGNATINSNIVLSSVKPTGDVVLTAGGAYTITGTGVLSGGDIYGKNTLTGMLGELGSTVTGTPAITEAPALTKFGTVTSGTLESGVTIPRGAAGVATVQLKKIGSQSGIATGEDQGTKCTWENATLNVGGHWDDTENQFVCPQTGIYRMGWGGAGYSGHDTVFRMYIWINGSKSTDGQLRLDQNSGQYFWGSRTALYQLSAGDYVDIRLSIDSSTTTWYADGTLQTYFNIEFLG